jgi:23S rRNA (pseudouridine1915-N3)-methyltransferase
VKLAVLRVGKSTERWADQAIEAWTKRLRRHGGLAQDWVKHEHFRGDVAAVKRLEGERLLKRVGERDILVALDERGQTPTSHELAEWIDGWRMEGAGSVVFALGGAYGHAPEVRQRADRVLSLSSMVLNHEVARVVLSEQIYRAFTILDGIPYHH